MESKKQELSDILELYVAGALPEEEMREITKLVATSPEIKAEVEELERAFMGYASLHAPLISDNTETKIRAIGSDAPQSTGSSLTPTGARERRLPLRRWFLAAASVLLLISLSANLSQYLQLRNARQQILALETQNDQYAGNLNALQARYDRTQQLFADIRRPGTQSITLGGTEVAPDAGAIVFWNPQNQEAYVDASALPEPPPGKVYQLWWLSSLDPLTPHDGGLLEQFSANEDRLFAPGKPIGEAVAFAITLEPAGGSAQPTLAQLYVLGTVG